MPVQPPSIAGDDRVGRLIELLQVMRGFAGAQPITPKAPSLPVEGAGGAQLAVDAAASAVKIANAVAVLGDSGPAGDQENATIIWQETLSQIERIQNLYRLPPMPFQTQTNPQPGAPA